MPIAGRARAAAIKAPAASPPARSLSYTARVALDRAQIDVDGELVNLTPGMAVTAEIKTGSRRIIEYFLAPVLRYRQESLRER